MQPTLPPVACYFPEKEKKKEKKGEERKKTL